MKLCVFQGTFNPIHNAHLDMAKFVLNKYDFDKIIFIPAFKPPHKDYDERLSRHRLNMVKLAVADNDRFEVSDIEYKSDRTSYTYLTIKELYTKYKIDDKIYFIIGTDAFEKFDTWYEAEKLKKLIKFIVFNRTNKQVTFNNGCDYEITTMNFEDISSTEIRKNVKNNKPITNLVPHRVEEYINANGIYKD